MRVKKRRGEETVIVDPQNNSPLDLDDFHRFRGVDCILLLVSGQGSLGSRLSHRDSISLFVTWLLCKY